MVDTGADVTIIDTLQWPWNWGLTSPSGAITGIGGTTTSQRSHHTIMVEGPECQFAVVKPFVLKSGITLWGRDFLLQWGPHVNIPCRDF